MCSTATKTQKSAFILKISKFGSDSVPLFSGYDSVSEYLLSASLGTYPPKPTPRLRLDSCVFPVKTSYLDQSIFLLPSSRFWFRKRRNKKNLKFDAAASALQSPFKAPLHSTNKQRGKTTHFSVCPPRGPVMDIKARTFQVSKVQLALFLKKSCFAFFVCKQSFRDSRIIPVPVSSFYS